MPQVALGRPAWGRGGGGLLEKQKIKISKMAATAAIFGILIFCFSKTGTKLPGVIGLATGGS